MSQVLTFLAQKALNTAESEIENRSQVARVELTQAQSQILPDVMQERLDKIASTVTLKRDLDLL